MEENSIINEERHTVVSSIEHDVITKDDIAKESLDNTSEDSVINEITERISALVSTEQYKTLKAIINKTCSLQTDNQDRVVSVEQTIKYANKYVRELSEHFLKVLLDTGWFEKYYDAVCLFNNAHESKEAMEWCEALKSTFDVSISDPGSSKIRALLNRQIVNAVFTLSVKTPYLRVKEGVFTELTPLVNIQARAFYGWLKNIEALSLRLRDLWVDIEFRTINTEPYIKNNRLLQALEKDDSLEDVANTLQSCDSLLTLKQELDFFDNHIADMIDYYEALCEANDRTIKYLTDNLLNEYYKKDLESIFGIYDAIQLSIDSLKSTCEKSDETERWSSLLESLSKTIVDFLLKQHIHKCPELTVDKTHIENEKFTCINNQDVDFFAFAKIISATDAPSEDLKNRVASIRNYGFYLLDSESRINILRETKVSVYN